MFGNFFGKSHLEEDGKVDAGYVQDLASSFLANLDRAGIVTDAAGIVQYLNEPAARLTAWSEAEAIGKPIDTVVSLVGSENGRQMGSHVTQALAKAMAAPLGLNTMLIRANGSQVAVEGSVAPVRNRDSRIAGALVLLEDVTLRRKITDSLAREACHDALTGLVNRREFQSRLEAAFAGSLRRSEIHALLYLDLDQFKVINDSCGHTAGDRLLCNLTERLNLLLHPNETLARLGGDEFGVLIQNTGLDDAVRVAENMLSTIKAFRFFWEGKSYTIGVSIGVTLMTRKSDDVNAVVSIADAACYAAKEKGRNRIQVYNPDDIELGQRQQEMRALSRISTALDENRFVLYYQPIIPLCGSDEDRQHCEILVRMINTDGTLAQPVQFIPAAERYNLMPALDRWVITRAFDIFHKRYPTPELQRAHQWSINISGTSLSSDSIVEFIREEAARHQIEPQSICFELTETAAIADIDRAGNFLWGLRMDGFRFALDDFGIGMSSFSYLKSLPVDYVKIDGEFVKNILDEKVSLAMTEAITRVAGVMGIQTVAEYVENISILERLREIGVSYAQGYGVSRPIVLEESANVSPMAELRMRKQFA
ncbi:MAG TPA: EAL domain-containing protein [Thiobacillaceae bacterium]|nr:EAL domain-containing protein [Thiobacillaceae bacterium]